MHRWQSDRPFLGIRAFRPPPRFCLPGSVQNTPSAPCRHFRPLPLPLPLSPTLTASTLATVSQHRPLRAAKPNFRFVSKSRPLVLPLSSVPRALRHPSTARSSPETLSPSLIPSFLPPPSPLPPPPPVSPYLIPPSLLGYPCCLLRASSLPSARDRRPEPYYSIPPHPTLRFAAGSRSAHQLFHPKEAYFLITLSIVSGAKLSVHGAHATGPAPD
jgi:hypothetical protein